MKTAIIPSIILIFVIVSVSSISCRKDENSSGAEAIASDASNGDTEADCTPERTLVTYSTDIKPILDQYCVSCHNEEASLNAGKPPTSFADFTSARAWGYLMPGFRLFENLSDEEKQTIQDWIAGGLTEDDYNNSAKAVIDTHCVTCHDANAPARKDLPNTNLSDPAIARLVGSQIPQFGTLKGVPEEQQKLLEQWITDGLLIDPPQE